MNQKIVLIGAVLMTAFLITCPVSAEYNAENPYNALWYSDNAWEDKLNEFMDMIGTDTRIAFMEVQDSHWRMMEEDLSQISYLLDLYDGVCDGSIDFSSLTAIEQYQMDCYHESGTFWSSEEQNRFITESLNAYYQWYVNDVDCSNDVIPSDAVFLPLPDKMSYNPDRSYICSVEPESPEIIYVEKPVEIVREIIREVPVEVVREIIREVPVEVVKEVEVIKEIPVENTLEEELPAEAKRVIEWNNNANYSASKGEEIHIVKTVVREFCENVLDWLFP